MPCLSDREKTLGHLNKSREGSKTENGRAVSGARSYLQLVPLQLALELEVGGGHNLEHALLEDILLEVLHLSAQLWREHFEDPSIRVLVGKRPGG